ncbi:energy-coupling factor transporter transmembrane component T family protein [Paenibacillus donghaensis]|nr:energy-coupling factor transporter transmembrane component T [Paenibacillus donghaensis]
MEIKMIRPRIEFDPRSQLLMVLLTSLAVFLADLSSLPWIIGFMAVYLVIQGIYKQTVLYLILVLLLYLLQGWISQVELEMIRFLGFITFLGLRFIPVFMATLSLGRVPSGKLMAALQKLRLPMGILIAITVSSRFIPVLKREYEAIQVSAKLRGISITSPRNWLRPLRTFEYTIVPLLMRSLKISDELAASATTKGIDFPGKKTSIYTIAFKGRDMAVLIAYAGWLIVVFRFGGAR